jgi:hypothetical protein
MKSSNKTAIIYSYCDEHARSQQNLHDFANAQLISNVDYFFAGSKDKLSVIQSKGNEFTKIHFHDGENEHQKISRFYRDHVQKSDYQSIVVVSSIMSGPYSMPDATQNWVQRFTGQLTKGTHLVGSAIVMMPADHPLAKVQNAEKAKPSTAAYVPMSSFAISREALDFLNTKCFFDQDIPACKLSLQLLAEMRMSDLLLKNGWNISCLLSKYSNIDFRSAKNDINPNSWLGDPRKENSYFGEDINKRECIFVETPDFEIGASQLNFKQPANVKLFGIFYDKKSRSAIANGFIPLDNSEGPKYLYESYPMLTQLERNLPEKDAWYGFFSPKFFEKTKITTNDIYGEIERADKDVSVLLFSSHWNQVAQWQNIWQQGDAFHPGLFQLTQKVIELAGYKIDITKTYSTLNDGVFSNYLVAKNGFWLEWRRLVSIYYNLIQNNEKLLKQPASYKGANIPIHTFVIERLASLIILELGLKTKFNQSLYNKGLDYNSIDGSEAIKLNQYKSKFNQTGDAAYIMMFNYHINKINERNKRELAKRLLLRKVGSRVA